MMLKVGLMMVNILIATLVFTAVVPPLTGGISVELPEEGGMTWEAYGHNISMNTTVRIINHAYYSINGITVWIEMNEGGSVLILNKTIEIPEVKAGSEVTQPISLVFNLDEIMQRTGKDLIFSDAEINMKVSVLATYTFRTIKFAAEYTDIYNWEALVREIFIDTGNASYQSSANGLEVTVPYVVETSSLLSGRTASVELILSNKTGEIARDYETVDLGTRFNGDITFTIPSSTMSDLLTRSQRLNIHATATIAGQKIERDYPYDWGAPFNNLEISDPYISGSSVRIPFSFDNDMDGQLNIRMLLEVFDSSDNQIGYGTDSFTVAPGEHVSRTLETTASGTPSYARITVEDLNSGLQYSMIRSVV